MKSKTNSTNGTTRMERKKAPPPGVRLSSEHICSIIDACSKGNVRTLDYEGLKLEFFGGPVQAEATIAAPTVAHPHLTEEELKESDNRDLLTAEVEHKEERAALMLIENPAEWERMIAAGEFEPPEGAEKTEDEVIENVAN